MTARQVPIEYDGSVPCAIPRQERYVLARISGMTCADAHKHAGYSGSGKQSTLDRLNRHPAVRARMDHLQRQAAENTVAASAVTRTEIIESLRDTRRMAKSGLINKKSSTGKEMKVKVETGRPDLASANRADEILAKMHGFMLDVTRKETLDEELDSLDPTQLRDYVLSLLEQLDPNLRKNVEAQIAAQLPAPEAPRNEDDERIIN